MSLETLPAAEVETVTEEPTPSAAVATLYLHGVKSSAGVKIRGYSGTPYSFKWDAGLKLCCRHYASAEAFVREELDIRKAPRTNFSICTLMGKPDPAANALEAVRVLIASGLRVPKDRRFETLHQIVQMAVLENCRLAESESDALSPIPAEQPIAEPPVPFCVAIEMHDRKWREGNGGATDPLALAQKSVPILPLTPTVTPARSLPVESADAVQPGQRVTQAQFMTMPWAQARQFAVKSGVEGAMSMNKADLWTALEAKQGA